MRSGHALLGTAIGFLGDPAWAAGGAFPYEVHTRTLDNGVIVHVVPMSSPGVVAFGTWMAVGSRDEVEPGRTGFAHFFEHLIFLGTPNLSGDARDRALLRIGADDNAWTWVDETVYHITLPTPALEEVVRMEADRFRHLTLTPEQVRREAGAVYGEYRKDYADPAEQLYDALHGAAFTTHTYRHSTIGYEADIAAMPGAHDYAGAFFSRYYRPDRARVLVVGDVEPAAAFALVATHYGPWVAIDPAPPPPPPVEPAQMAPRRVTVELPGLGAPRLAMGWHVPGADPANADVAALSLVEGLLLSEVGRIRRRLVDEEQLAFEVGGGREDFVDPCLFVVEVELRPGVDPAVVEAAIRAEVAAIQRAVEPAALERVRQHARFRFLSSLDDPMEVLHALGQAARRGGGPEAIDAFYAAFDAATPESVAAAAARWLIDPGLTVAVVKEAP